MGLEPLIGNIFKMNHSSAIGLINNAALLLALCLLYDMLGFRLQERKTIIQQILTGIVLGAIGLAIMFNPWDFGQGVVFDTRSVLLVISGFFFGAGPVVVAMFMTGVFRLMSGGAGVWTGLAVIVTSGVIGLLWRHYRPYKNLQPSIGELYLLGIVVHLAMLGWFFLLPWMFAIDVLSKISLPVMLIYPVATAILGNLMVMSEKRRQAQEALLASEARMRTITDSAKDAILMMDPEGRVSFWNPAAVQIFGYTSDEALGMNLHQLLAPQRYHDDHNAAFSKFKLTGQGAAIDATLDLEACHKNGHEIAIGLSLSALYLEGGWHTVGIVRDITERKQAEEVLRASEEDLKESQRIAHVGSWRLNFANNQVIWSDELYKMYGFDPTLPPPTYTEHKKLFTPESWDRLSAALQYTRDTGIPYDLELETVRADGSHGWMWVHGLTIRDAKGVAVGLRGMAQDITEHKQAEEALRQSDERHRKYLMNAPYGIFVTDEKGRYQQVNPAACSMSGYEEQELLAMSIADLFFEESIEKGLQHFQRVLHQGQSQGELLFRLKNGERRWWSVNAVKISETQFLGFCIDVTERKQTEELIQKRILSLTQPLEFSEVKLEDLFNLDEIQTIQDQFALATGVASIITRIDGTPVTTPSSFTRLCNEIIRKTEQGCANCIKSDAALGRHNPDGPIVQRCLSGGLWDAGVNIIVGDHHIANWMIGQVRNEAQSEEGLRAYAALIGVEEEPFMQAFREVPSMSVERFESIAQALFTLVNQLCNTAYQNVLQARFISERKQAEKEKDKLQVQLTQAQKMEAVGQLAGGVAHDFNNMLGVIIGHAELAMEEIDPTQSIFADLEEIRKAATRSADITRQLLAFARKQTVSPKILNLNETVEGMLKMLRRLIGENIDLAWFPETGLWQVRMDPSQIDQILANLCVNARDAIAGIGKMIVETGNSAFDKDYCDTHPGFVPGEYVRIAVSDSGQGMDKETLAHIFEPFFTTKGVGEGTGLGLATVYGAVKQNNGFINAYSEPGEGTTFTIYLPRYLGTPIQTPTPGSAEPALRGNETILLVEDEPTILIMTTTMLERMGYTVLAANTPSEANRLVRDFASEIHLLITDVIMPEMNGRALAEQLLEKQPGMKCLFMSGYTANVISQHGVLDDGVYFIQKPFAIKELAAKVREVFNNEDDKIS